MSTYLIIVIVFMVVAIIIMMVKQLEIKHQLDATRETLRHVRKLNKITFDAMDLIVKYLAIDEESGEAVSLYEVNDYRRALTEIYDGLKRNTL
jgi:hypothetical protein